jgi:hypothetical protein
MTASLMISGNATLAARFQVERMTGIEPALSAWEALSVCCAEYSRIAYGTTDLAISDGTGAASGVETLVENLLPHKPLASCEAQCSAVRAHEGVASAGR